MKTLCASCGMETEHDTDGFCDVCGRNAAASELSLRAKARSSIYIPKWAKIALWGSGAAVLFTLNFAHDPEKAIQTVISTGVQALGLAAVVGVYRLFKK